MNTENLDYLKNQVKYMGFGEKLNDQLESSIKLGKPEFDLNLDTTLQKDKLATTLHFKKSESTDMYFFNKYDAVLTKCNDLDNKMSQTFYINKGQSNITAKEAYNLLSGRAVHKDLSNKEGMEYKAWVQLDFNDKDDKGNYKTKQYHQNYGFDVEASVTKLPIKELKYPDQKDTLLKSLQKGNLQSVTIVKDGTENKMFIEANPQYKTINVYDSGLKQVKKETLQEDKSASKATQKEVGQGKESKQEANASKKNGTKINTGKADSLMPKKRERAGKGLSV